MDLGENESCCESVCNFRASKVVCSCAPVVGKFNCIPQNDLFISHKGQVGSLSKLPFRACMCTLFLSVAMFTLYRIVKRSVAESVPDRASVYIRNAAFEAVSAPEQYCSAPLLKVERSVSDRFLRRSESSLNTFIGAEIATEPRIGKLSFQIKRERCKLHNG